MFNSDRGLAEDVLSLRNQLRLTERNLQAVGEQLLCSVREMETETSQLRRKFNTVRQENSSLVLENRQLITDLETTQLELANSKSKLQIRLLGSSIGAKSSSVSVMKDHIQDLESQLETQTKALEAEQKLAASEQSAVQTDRLVQKLRDELKTVKSELSDSNRTEQQRNQALRNAEKLTVAFKDYKEDVAEKLKKVMENEGKLKASLIECDGEREELEERCKELEREKERMSQNLELKEGRNRAESVEAEGVELQGRFQQVSERLIGLQKELKQKEAELEEVSGLRREREDLRLLSACQEQRLAQAQREMEQSRVELTSLERVLDLLHLRENREGALCVNPCVLASIPFTANTDQLRLKPGDGYQKLLMVLQTVEKEKNRQISAAQNLQDRLNKAQQEISSLQTSITQRASHYQQLHNQLLDKAAQATRLEKEKKNTRLSVLEKQLQEKTAAYSQSAIRTSQLEQQILQEKDSSINHYQSVLNKKQRENQQILEKIKLTELSQRKELEEQKEELQESLVQSKAEVEDLKQAVCSLRLEKTESQHQLSLLEASIAQLTQQDYEKKLRSSKEEMRNLVEQTLQSASKVKYLESELCRCSEELSVCVQQVEQNKQQYETQLELKNSEEAVRSRALDCKSSSEENLQLQISIQRQHSMLQESTTRIAQLEESQNHLHSQQLSSEMNTCRGELSEMEKELLRLRRDSSAKASQLSQMEEVLQETRGLLDKKSEMNDLEEKLHRSEMDRRNSLQRAQLLEGQMQTVRGELVDTMDHLQELRDVLQRTQLTSEQRQTTIDQLAAELESKRELEERNNEVLDMDTALKERQGELQQRAQLLGQLDVAIKEKKLEMDRKVEHLQDVLEKTEKKLKDKDKEAAVEYSQQLRVCGEQLQKTAQELQDALARCDWLSRQLNDVTQQTRNKPLVLPQLSALQQTRGQLLKVSDQISSSLRSSQEQLTQRLQLTREQLDQSKAEAAKLRAQLSSTEQLLQDANETLLIKESEITRLQAKISSLERATDLHNATLHHESSSFPSISSSFKELQPYSTSHKHHHDHLSSRSSLCSSTSWRNASSDSSLELSESVKAGVQAALRCPSSVAADWQGLSNPDLSATSDTTFNPLTYMLDGGEAEEPDMETLSGMLKFVNQTLALQEQHSLSSSHL
uniref:Coiled-coil domain containing 18 n=1 Tax=Astyanax mexicanus TaxID=7994 RepID=A0A3B1JAK3_ASTMX